MPKQERGFVYKKRTKEDLKERANMKGGNYDTIFKPQYKVWKPQEGKNIIRILPPTWKGAKHYGLDIFVNYSVGPDKQSYLSLSKHGKGADPLAEARREAQNEGDKEYAKALNFSQRILYWIIDRRDEDEGPQLWAAPFTFDKDLANLCIDEDAKDIIDIVDPVDGRDIRFHREGTMLNTKYPAAKMKVLGPSSVHEDEGIEEEWLNFIQDNQLPDVLNFYTYDHIKAQFDGGSSKTEDDDDDDAADEKPARRSRKPADDEDEDEKPARARRKPADEDDDETEEKPTRARQRSRPTDDGDDDAEDEKPSRRTASRRQVDDDDSDDDEADEKPTSRRQRVKSDDDDDEDEKPARRRSRPDPDDDDEDERPSRSSRRGKTEPEDDDEPEEKPRGGNLREKLAARRRSRSSDED